MMPGRAITVLLLLLATGCRAAPVAEALPDDLIVRVSEDEVKSLDPQAASDLATLRVAADQFEGLTRYRGDGSVEPGLAAGWSVDDTGTLWRFRLRPGLRFSDHTPITAQTIAASFDRLLDPKAASPHRILFDAIESVRAGASGSIEIRLHRPFPALPELLAHPAAAALPMHRVAAIGAAWTQDRPLVTSGAYRLTEWRLHDHITLARNPAWHDPPAPIARIRWRPVDDRQTALRLFLAGGADQLSDFPSERHHWLQRERPGAVRIAPYRGVYYFVFNTRRPPFDDVRVRRALNLTVERGLIAERLIGLGVRPAWGVVPPEVSGDARPIAASAAMPRAARLAEAKRLLAEAGYGDARPLCFEIRFNSDVDHRRIAVALLDNWKGLPVKPRLLNSEATLHFASLRRGDFDLARTSWIGDLSVPENFLAVHRGDAGPINYSGYASPAFDGALDRALAASDPAARAAAMRTAETVLMRDAPVLPIYFYSSKNLVSARLGGWQNNLANLHPSRTLFVRTP